MRCSKARGVEGIIPCAFLQISQYNTLRFFTDFDILYLALFYNSRAREAIKALVEDGRYDYIETGSLISIKENVEDILIPSEEHSIRMYPMDFEEFCMACGEEQLLDYIKTCFDKKIEVERDIHQKAMLLIKQYMIVGGMPQSVNAYLEGGKSFFEADIVKREILSLYRKDIQKASKKYMTKTLQIYDGIPGYLSKHEKRVTINNIDAGQVTNSLGDAFFWLADSMIANECFGCNDPNVGLSLNEDRTYVKCYMGDTGLLLSHAFSEKEITEGELYKKLLNDRLSINKGMLSNGSKTNYKINPVEVKSSKNYTTTSLTSFRNKYKKRVETSYVIHPKNLRIDNEIMYMPVYMTFLL